MRGATGKGDGKHVLTGPIFLCGAEPGDVIEVRCTLCCARDVGAWSGAVLPPAEQGGHVMSMCWRDRCEGHTSG